jgi:hypothetical protein
LALPSASFPWGLTGEIYDGDMDINSEDYTFVVDTDCGFRTGPTTFSAS